MSYSKGKYPRRSRSRSKSKERVRENSRSRSRGRREPQPSEIEYQPTQSLSINKPFDQPLIQSLFDSLSIQHQTSLPDQVKLLNNITIISYPSIESASKILQRTNKRVEIQGKHYQVQYYPKRDLSSMHQDWECDKCNYTNYPRRNKCNRCENVRNSACRTVFNSNAALRVDNPNRDEINPSSLMVRGEVICSIEEGALMDIFEKYAPLKDIRMIRNRATGGYKDFAFLEFFSPQEAAVAFQAATDPSFRIQGESISCLYSKNRKQQPLRQQPHSRHPKHPPTSNYYQLQRQRQIKHQQQKQLITMQMLKERKQQQIRKHQLNSLPKELSKEKMNRKLAEQSLREWEKSVKAHNAVTEIMYVCPLCVRKFKGERELREHEERSAMHKRVYDRLIG